MNDACEIPEFYSETRHVARKDHKCCECNFPIKAGTPYIACRGKWDGIMDSHRQHEECYDLCRYVNLDVIGDCEIGFTGMLEWIWEHVRLSADCATELSSAAILVQLRVIEYKYAPKPSVWLHNLVMCEENPHPDINLWLKINPWAFPVNPVNPVHSLKDRAAQCPVLGSKRSMACLETSIT